LYNPAGLDFIDSKQLLDAGMDDRTLRALVRLGLARLLVELGRQDAGARRAALLRELAASPVAVHTAEANAQHYEVAPAFFRLVLGRRMKYSAGYWSDDAVSLDDAEEAALRLVFDRAVLEDGQEILDLGCGWGAFTLTAAEAFPHARLTALSHSRAQKGYIEEEAARRGLRNVRVVTADVSTYEADRRFDRIVSIEMLEHVRNHRALLASMTSWLAPGGRLFVHVFSHARHAYVFEDNWLARHFFTGGIMLSDDLLPSFAEPLVLEGHWPLSGRHYQRTAEAWLANLDQRRDEAEAVLSGDGADARERRAMWRLFFIVTAESFGFREGSEWIVSHYLFRHPD
jgi:cyclopropane-fatty-acyl-phospholipid synthase